MLIGIAPQGGRLPRRVARAGSREALDGGCDLWSGLHTFLGDDPLLAARGRGAGPDDPRSPKAAGRPPDRRGLAKEVEPLVVLTVGTDCNVGKMTAQLQLIRRPQRARPPDPLRAPPARPAS